MMLLLLGIIYLVFIGIGLPDGLLGSAWPLMRIEMAVPLSYAGVISLLISGGTIISSFLNGKLAKKWGTGILAFFSVLLSAAALLGFFALPGFWWLCLAAMALGLGAGAVNAAMNSFIALHYSARHMNWLHCFWGVGATIGPLVMSAALAGNGNWRSGYLTIALFQFALVLILALALPLWKKTPVMPSAADHNPDELKLRAIFAMRGVKPALGTFFAYCAAEVTVGLWGSSYLVTARFLPAETAAKWISMYFLSITAGRFISGFALKKLNIISLSRLGQWVGLAGVIILILPLPVWLSMIGLILIGIGLSPVIPGMLHNTPGWFGKPATHSLIGIQMAFAFAGGTILPPLFGLLAGAAGLGTFPYAILFLTAAIIIASERVNRIGTAAQPPDMTPVC